MFAPVVRLGAKLCKLYIQRFAILGHKSKDKLIDLRICLDMLIADEVRWILYRPEEITDVWISTWHRIIAYFDCVESYMPDRVVKQFEQGIHGQECVHRGTVSPAYGDIGQCPCCTTILVHRRLHALISLLHSSKDSESGKAPTRRAIVDGNSHYTAGSRGYDIS
ncbi:hypothetical protein M9H77_01565 [Catharanthus roseus]|uniref:Uncharacterized protein n=1 Tax=Catharanthus roseus TaxID=4058 RepID=A0ACC0C6D9_CATRO|nr:hypothetical protein M9H77_01565 [Catharanthus roseus]